MVKLESSSPKDVCTKFGSNWPSGPREEDEMKVYDNDDDKTTTTTTDNGQIVIRKVHLSLQLR